MPQKIGWKSLKEAIKKEAPDIIGAGENHALYAHEVTKLFAMTKDISAHIITIAGGTHFSALAQDYIKNQNIDFIVKGEGEETLKELITEISKTSPSYKNIQNIAFKENGNIIETPFRPLIEDLDTLPLPAYDLVPMAEYGKSKYLFSPGGTTIHHSRGCSSKCKFCAFWVQMADKKEVNGQTISTPKWRTKSVAKTITEIELLYNNYQKECLVFVDESFNISQNWNQEFAETLISKPFNIKYFAFMRLDFILRDEKAGIFEKMIKSGLSHICIGVERSKDQDLNNFGKNFYSNQETVECFEILNSKYPSLFKQATFIIGTKDETKESCLAQVDFAKKLKVDFPAFHPLTPVPGTELWEEEKKAGNLENLNFQDLDWATPILPSQYLTRDEILDLIYIMNKRFLNFKWLFKGLFSKYTYKRRMYIWWFTVSLRLTLDSLIRFINPLKAKIYTKLEKPKWYNS